MRKSDYTLVWALVIVLLFSLLLSGCGHTAEYKEDVRQGELVCDRTHTQGDELDRCYYAVQEEAAEDLKYRRDDARVVRREKALAAFFACSAGGNVPWLTGHFSGIERRAMTRSMHNAPPRFNNTDFRCMAPGQVPLL